MAFHVRKDDIVQVIAGDHQGERGKVLKIIPKRNLVLVEGINMVFRHVRPSKKNPQGGRLQKEAPIQLSNVMPYDEKAGKGTRVRFQVNASGAGRKEKTRVSVKGTRLSVLSRARAEK